MYLRELQLAIQKYLFKFWNNDDLVYDYTQSNLEERIKNVFDNNILSGLIEVEENTEYLSLNGYVAKPTFLRKSRGEQFLFINRRYVNSKTVNHAVFTAYDHLLDKGEYPFFVLFMELDSKRIDINVHPSKMEVKFDDDRNIYNFVKAIIRKSIGQYDLTPNINLEVGSSLQAKLKNENSDFVQKNDFSDRPNFISKNEVSKKEKGIIWR